MTIGYVYFSHVHKFMDKHALGQYECMQLAVALEYDER